MLTVRLRLWRVVAAWAAFDRQKPPCVSSRLALTCWWTDADINRHMNNSRYLALMDVGRWHYLLVTGLARVMWQRRLAPVAVRVEIDFKRSIRPGERFVLESVQESHSRKTATIRQRFWVGDELAAEARVVVLFLEKGKVIELEPLMAELPHLVADEAGAAGEPVAAHG